MTHAKEDMFLVAAICFGKMYLTYGGSISKLESSLSCAAANLGLVASVHATPTGISISLLESESGRIKSLSARLVNEVSNLTILSILEKILSQFSKGELSPIRLKRIIENKKLNQLYPKYIRLFAIFLIGSTITFNRTLDPFIAFIAGIITVASAEIVNSFKKYLPSNSIVIDFLSCSISISISFLVSIYFKTHPSNLFIGSLALALPGLVLTNAFFELMDQQYLTGMVKLSKSFLVLLSLGFSYLITSEVFASFGFLGSSTVVEFSINSLQFLFRIFSTSIMVCSFAFLLQVPRKSILYCIGISLFGWIVFSMLNSYNHIYLGAFMGSACIAFLSRMISNLQGRSTQVYLVPGLLMLVPGLLAFSFVEPLMDKDLSAGALHSVLSSLMIACALSFGIFLGGYHFVEKKTKQF